jgi:hypothetical protein
MPKFNITYSVELEVPEGVDPRIEAYYWHDRLLRDSKTELPDNIYWVQTLPDIQEEAL